MQQDLIREIATQIVREQILGSWLFYALIGALSLVASAAAHWLAPYLKRRAETVATKADMNEILAQLRETTKIAEQVRSEVAHADWVAREWRTIRRTKLEEVLVAAHSLDRWLDEVQKKWIYKEIQAIDIDAPKRIKVLTALYFPELNAESNIVQSAHRSAYMFILEIAKQVGSASNDATAYEAAMKTFIQGWGPHSEAAATSVAAFERKAAQLMQSLAGA